MAIRREQFREWQTHAVTEQLKSELRETLEILVAQMVNRMEPDPARDSFTRAFAKAVDSIISWQPEFTSEDQDNA
jgi:hypothetical protein